MPPYSRITITEEGPYLVTGGVPLYEVAIAENASEHHQEYRPVRDFHTGDECYALCRCGKSKRAPFCDCSHLHANADGSPFEGHETASRAPYTERAQAQRGAGVTLLDDGRCAFARFCHRAAGDVWTLTGQSGNTELRHEAIEASWNCPSGRLVHLDAQTGEELEQELEPSIFVLEDTGRAASGPLFVRGGIKLRSADGTEYEVRNRYALCRCGNSANKPFCDAAHITFGFNDGSSALTHP